MKDQKKVDRIFLVIFDATVFLTAAFSIWFLIDPSGITEFLYGDMHPLGDLVMTLMFLPAFYLSSLFRFSGWSSSHTAP